MKGPRDKVANGAFGMGADFNVAGTNYLSMTGGSAGAAGTGAYTIAWLGQPAVGNNGCGMLQLRASGSSVRSLLEDTNKLFGDGDFSSGFGTLTQGNWYLCAQTKPAGSAVYRFHLWPYASDGSGTMTHGVSVGAGNHGDGSSIDDIRIGQAGNPGNGPVSLVCVWNSELADATLDALKSNQLSAWTALFPAELIHFASWNGTTGVTVPIGTSALSSITGTVGVGSDAPSFNFSLTTSAKGPSALVGPGAAVTRQSVW